jgi:hypothetical protein
MTLGFLEIARSGRQFAKGLGKDAMTGKWHMISQVKKAHVGVFILADAACHGVKWSSFAIRSAGCARSERTFAPVAVARASSSAASRSPAYICLVACIRHRHGAAINHDLSAQTQTLLTERAME